MLRVDNGNTTTALDFKNPVWGNKDRGIFIDADAQQERVIGNRVSNRPADRAG